MHKVLLVDDEMLDLEGLERLIPWEELHMQVVAALYDSFEALQYIREQEVDILVSDIKMPIMSGLELARKALEIRPALKIVFVSGYEDFQYAKQAIQMNAYGYVLKPVDDREMMRVMREVDAGMRREQQIKRMEEKLVNSVALAQDGLLLRWLEGTGGAAGTEELAEQAGISGGREGYQASVLQLDDMASQFEPLPQEQRKTRLHLAFAQLTEELERERIALHGRMDAYNTFLILEGDTNEERLERIVAGMRRRGDFTITACLGPGVSGWSELPASFQAAKELLAYKMFCGKDKVIQHADIESLKPQNVESIDDLSQRLFTATTQYDLIGIDDCLRELYDIVKQLGKRTAVYNATLHMLAKLDANLAAMNENVKKMLHADLEHFDILYQFETIEEIHAWLRRRLFEISEMLHLKSLKKNHRLIQEIEDYVTKHLDDNLTLRDVANYLSFSPNYLGHLFKEETGGNFSDYVIMRRMERARDLLEDPRMKIYEAAYQVGYKNLTYFSRQFKERFGLNPGDYRRKNPK